MLHGKKTLRRLNKQKQNAWPWTCCWRQDVKEMRWTALSRWWKKTTEGRNSHIVRISFKTEYQTKPCSSEKPNSHITRTARCGSEGWRAIKLHAKATGIVEWDFHITIQTYLNNTWEFKAKRGKKSIYSGDQSWRKTNDAHSTSGRATGRHVIRSLHFMHRCRKVTVI